MARGRIVRVSVSTNDAKEDCVEIKYEAGDTEVVYVGNAQKKSHDRVAGAHYPQIKILQDSIDDEQIRAIEEKLCKLRSSPKSISLQKIFGAHTDEPDELLTELGSC